MNRPSTFETRLEAWLEEGPTTGPDELLADVHARARSVRQRPGWWLALKGDPMTTTWRARPAHFPGRLAFILLTALLILAIAAATLLVGSRLITQSDAQGTDGAMAVAPAIPEGDEALLAFTSWNGEPSGCDLFVVRADGADSRRITSDELCDWSPAWSPDGGKLAFYSSDDDRIQLRVAASDGIRVLDESPGCFQSTQPPAWSPDGRFILYAVDRLPDDGVCELADTDLFVVPADGSGPGQRLLSDSQTQFTTMPDWSDGGIVMAGNDGSLGGLWSAPVTDPDRPWGLESVRVDGGYPDRVSFSWSRWSPTGDAIASHYIPAGTGFGTALVYEMDDATPRTLLDDPTKDQISPAWSPDGTWLTLLELSGMAPDHGIYHLVVVGRDGSDPRTIETPNLNGNGGPAVISPDGTRAAARAEIDGDATPGDILIVPLQGGGSTVRVPSILWSTVDWQPVVNADDPAASAPEGTPAL
jgi:Tol biopolymer transport system component